MMRLWRTKRSTRRTNVSTAISSPIEKRTSSPKTKTTTTPSQLTYYSNHRSSSVQDQDIQEEEEEEEGGEGTLLTDMFETSKEDAEKQRRELLELLALNKGGQHRNVKERSEGLIQENEHALKNDTKLSLEDLTAGMVTEPGLSKRLSELSKTKTKEAPLAPVIKERIERTVHYASTKKQVKEWVRCVRVLYKWPCFLILSRKSQFYHTRIICITDLYSTRENHWNSNAQMHTQMLRKTRTPTLEHRYRSFRPIEKRSIFLLWR